MPTYRLAIKPWIPIKCLHTGWAKQTCTKFKIYILATSVLLVLASWVRKIANPKPSKIFCAQQFMYPKSLWRASSKRHIFAIWRRHYIQPLNMVTMKWPLVFMENPFHRSKNMRHFILIDHQGCYLHITKWGGLYQKPTGGKHKLDIWHCDPGARNIYIYNHIIYV